MLGLRIFFSISSNSFLGIWIGLEINLSVIIPIFLIEQNGKTEKRILTFFLIQRISSIIILLSFFRRIMFLNFINVLYLFIFLSIFIKIGIFPFFFWVPKVIEGLRWINCFILRSIQKIVPLLLIFILNFNKLIFILSVLNIIISSINGINQFSLRKIITFSSLNHLSLIILTIFFSKKLLKLYFYIYSFITFATMYFFSKKNINYIFQSFLFNKRKITIFLLLILILSISGTPPFIGFFPKIIIILKILEINFFVSRSIILLRNVLTTFFYIRVSFSRLFLNVSSLKIVDSFKKNDNTLYVMSIFISPFILFF